MKRQMPQLRVLKASDPLTVGPLRLRGRVLLAPMSGISDWPFRVRAEAAGATLVVSEMVASERLVAREAAARLKTEGAGLSTHAVQLAGCTGEALAQAARIAADAGAHLIDINMGCPAKRVMGAWAGSALMADTDHAARLVEAVVGAVALPVSVKMRLGLDRARLNAAELARKAELAGAQMLTVHGRTRAQKYSGRADWAAIRPVVDAVSIPVIANGDAASAADVERMLAHSGAAGAMVGRASVGAPWLPGAINAALLRTAPPTVPDTPQEIGAYALSHFDDLVACAGPRLGVKLARKHIAAYAERVVAPQALRRAALTAPDAAGARAAVAAVFAAAAPLPSTPSVAA